MKNNTESDCMASNHEKFPNCLILHFDYYDQYSGNFLGVKIGFDESINFLRVDRYLTPRKIKQLYNKKIAQPLVSLSFVDINNFANIAKRGISVIDNSHCKWFVTEKTFRKIKKYIGAFIIEPQKIVVYSIS